MENIGMENNLGPGYGQRTSTYGDFRQQSGANLNTGSSFRPGVPNQQSAYSTGLMSDVTSTAGYTLSGQNDPDQEQNMQFLSRELTEGMLSLLLD
jgi:hypothetical protein